MPQSITTAAASAALKAMKGITMAPKPPDLRRHSSSSVADVSSQASEFAFRTSSATRACSMTPSAPIAIGSFRDSSNEDSFGSSMYTDTILEGSGSVTSDNSMRTTKTNKTRRGKRGGKKQRESSQKFRMQSMPAPPSPMQVEVSIGCCLGHHTRASIFPRPSLVLAAIATLWSQSCSTSWHTLYVALACFCTLGMWLSQECCIPLIEALQCIVAKCLAHTQCS